MTAQKGSFKRIKINGLHKSRLTQSVGLVLSYLVVGSPALATDFTAGVVMEKMEGKERYAFVAGVVEGLAIARYMRDGKKPEGAKCIYDWFYKGNDTAGTVYTAFQRYPDYPPGTVVSVMLKKTCGE